MYTHLIFHFHNTAIMKLLAVLLIVAASSCVVPCRAANDACQLSAGRDCSQLPQQPLCASDRRTYQNTCFYGKAKCMNSQLQIMSAGECPTTTAPTTTTTIDPINILFCKNVMLIQCSNQFDTVCGSDGKVYPNACELAKAKCYNPGLTNVAMADCRTVVVG